MTIASEDALVAGMIGAPVVFGKDADTAEAAGVMHTPWYNTGITGAGAAPTGGLNGATFSATSGVYTGGIRMPAAVTGENSYLAALDVNQAGSVGELWIVDKLWGNVPVVTTTTGQAVTSPAWPARDVSGSTNGVGVLLALEVSATTGNAGAITNTTVTYTNSSGTASKTATIASVPATAQRGTWIWFSLAAGDAGVRSVQTVTLGTSYVSGTIHITAWRLVARVSTPTANVGSFKDFTALGLPIVWDDSVLQTVYVPTGTACGAVVGSVTFAQG